MTTEENTDVDTNGKEDAFTGFEEDRVISVTIDQVNCCLFWSSSKSAVVVLVTQAHPAARVKGQGQIRVSTL